MVDPTLDRRLCLPGRSRICCERGARRGRRGRHLSRSSSPPRLVPDAAGMMPCTRAPRRGSPSAPHLQPPRQTGKDGRSTLPASLATAPHDDASTNAIAAHRWPPPSAVAGTTDPGAANPGERTRRGRGPQATPAMPTFAASDPSERRPTHAHQSSARPKRRCARQRSEPGCASLRDEPQSEIPHRGNPTAARVRSRPPGSGWNSSRAPSAANTTDFDREPYMTENSPSPRKGVLWK